MSLNDIHSLRKRGNSYLIVVSMGYDCAGNRLKSMQQTVHPPAGMTPKQTEKWLNELTVEGVHACLCGILSDAVESGLLDHNPAWRTYAPISIQISIKSSRSLPTKRYCKS